jgi:hypothetical protein
MSSVFPNNRRKSTYSSVNDCVVIADNAQLGVVSDSKNRGPQIVLPRAAFDAFLRSAVETFTA